MAASVTVGFIGLGEQGLPIARRIAGTFPTLVWARRPQACAAIPQARAVATVEDLGRAADIVCLCVNGDDDVRELAGRLAPAMAPGKTIVVMSTVLPDTVTDLAARLAPRGIALVDAPVSGGPDGAERGDMVVLVGAGEDDFARVLPLFRTFARLVERLGCPR